MNISDKQLESKICHFKKNIESWIAKESGTEPISWYSFKSWAEYFDDEPEESPCVLVMCIDELIATLFNYDDKFFEGFEKVVDKSPFYFVQEDSSTICFYVEDQELDEAYKDYFEWLWICDLLIPDYGDLYEELFLHFVRNPDNLHKLLPRKFEYLLDAVFRNNGYRTKLGPGVGDGGVDIHLYTKDAIGDIVTLVQAKRYAESRPIHLEAVAALLGHMHDQQADEGLFVATSRFLPSAQKFAGRQSKRLTLAGKADILEWSKKAATRIVRDKSILVSDEHIRKLLNKKIDKGLEGKIMCAHKVYGFYEYYDFCLVLRETVGSVLLMRLPSKEVSGVNVKLEDPYGQYGYKIPVLNSSVIKNKTEENVFRAKKLYNDNKLSLWGERNLYTPWDGEPKFFNSMD